MGQRLPWPKESKPFEQLCKDLWQAMAPDRRWELYAGDGQGDRGVDVVGSRDGEPLVAIQCKARDRFLGSTVTEKHLDGWIDTAKTGGLRFERLIVATTAPLRRQIQDHVRERGDPFQVEYWAWDRLEDEIRKPEHLDVLARHWPQFRFRSDDQERLVRHLDRIVPDLQDLGMRWLREPDARGGGQSHVLEDVYTMLDVDANVDGHGPRTERELPDPPDRDAAARAPAWDLPADPRELGELRQRLHDQDARPATILEAAAVNPRLVVTGVGGSGKSSFLRFLALCVAGERLAQAGRTATATLATLTGDDPTRWTHGMLVPLWIDLRDFARSAAFPNAGAQTTRQRLWDYLEEKGRLDDGLQTQLVDLMSREHPVDGVLLALDGLDEVEDRATNVPLLLDVLADFLRAHPSCRVLLTARPYAVEDQVTRDRLRELGFEFVGLAPPSLPTIRAFLAAWFRPVEGGDAIAGRMGAFLEQHPKVCEILRTPLILTLVAMLYAEGSEQRWNNRADIFTSAVDRLVDRWNAGRGIDGAAVLAPHVAELHAALDALAWRVMTEEPSDAQEDRWFGRSLLEDALGRAGIQEQALRQDLPLYLRERCGIIDWDGGEGFRFAHKNLLEFLVARGAARHVDHPLPLLEQAEAEIGDWQEVLLFAGALGARGQGVGAWTLLDHAVPVESPDGAGADDPRWRLLACCGEIVDENGLTGPARAADVAKLDRLRQWLQRCLEVGALPVRRRAAVGRYLAGIGDRRRGVGLRTDGLPDVDWVPVRCGDEMLRVARFPITVEQFGAFFDGHGYTELWKDCWTVAGWEWRSKENREGPDDYDAVFQLGNHPRVGVSLHEAHAFAAWLDRQDPEFAGARLPTREEWCAIARGDEGRRYAWGDEDPATRCNFRDAGIGSTSAVGMFPAGATPDGVHELTGNVWEWVCRNSASGRTRGGWLGGGSWRGAAGALRRAMDAGSGVGVGDRYGVVGFRVVAPACR